MIDRVAFAAATDESRPVLTGVLAELTPTALTFAAADSYRLSVASTPLVQGPPNPLNMIIPARALQELRRISNDVDVVEMRMAPNHNQVSFTLTISTWSRNWWRAPSPTIARSSPPPPTPNHRQHAPSSCKAARMAAIFARDCGQHRAVQHRAGRRWRAGPADRQRPPLRSRATMSASWTCRSRARPSRSPLTRAIWWTR